MIGSCTGSGGGELTYRRTVVHVLPEGGEGGEGEAGLLCDPGSVGIARAGDGDVQPARAGDKIEREGEGGRTIRFDGMTLFVAQPAEFEFESFPSTTATWLAGSQEGREHAGCAAVADGDDAGSL